MRRGRAPNYTNTFHTPREENHNLQFKFKDQLSAAGSHIKPNVMSELHLVHTDGRRNKRTIITVTSSTSFCPCRRKPIHFPLCMMNRWARESIVQSIMHVMQIWSTQLQDVREEKPSCHTASKQAVTTHWPNTAAPFRHNHTSGRSLCPLGQFHSEKNNNKLMLLTEQATCFRWV